MLARLGRADESLLSPIQHRSEESQRALVRLKVREALVRSRVNAMNSVRFLLKSLGVLVPSGSKAMTFTRRLRPMLDETTWALVEPLLTLVDTLNAKVAQMDDELETFGREQYPVTERLRQVDGVGPLTALACVRAHNRRASAGCVVPMHREVKVGTLTGVLRQAGIDPDEFIRAVQ